MTPKQDASQRMSAQKRVSRIRQPRMSTARLAYAAERSALGSEGDAKEAAANGSASGSADADVDAATMNPGPSSTQPGPAEPARMPSVSAVEAEK